MLPKYALLIKSAAIIIFLQVGNTVFELRYAVRNIVFRHLQIMSFLVDMLLSRNNRHEQFALIT